jgi:hypothetical protein
MGYFWVKTLANRPPTMPHQVPARPHLIFQGAPGSPLLAPRGVSLGPDWLVVADTGQNRVFVWRPVPTEPSAEPSLILGQPDAAHTGRNAGALGLDAPVALAQPSQTASASSLLYPSGVWSDGQRLVVADAWNHRVLVWHTFPQANGQPADVVLGQPNFVANQPNVGGLHQAPSAQSLYWPYGVWSDGERLWVADTGNRRVLYYAQLPRQNFAPADAVVGQANFGERDYGPDHAIWPYSVKTGPGGELAIADVQYHRVLLWAHWSQALAQPAAVVVGQPDHAANGANQFGLRPAAHTLNWCYDALFADGGLWAVDTGNSRLLWFGQVPGQSGAAATAVLGKPDFQTSSENLETFFGTEKTLYWPFAASVSGRQLAVADTGNHRILFYET